MVVRGRKTQSRVINHKVCCIFVLIFGFSLFFDCVPPTKVQKTPATQGNCNPTQAPLPPPPPLLLLLLLPDA